MRKASFWLGLVATTGLLAGAGCSSPAASGSASPSTSWWPWPSNTAKAAPKPAPISDSDPTSLANKSAKPGPDLYVATARVNEKSGNAEEAAAQYKKALAIDPANLPALLGYAHLLDDQRHFVEADRHYYQAIKTHPNDAAPFNDLALSLQRRGMADDALKMYGRAIALQPNRPLYRNNLAVLLVQMNRPEDALTQLSAVNPPAVAHYNLATMLHRAGNDEGAALQFAAAAQMDPSMSVAREWAQRLGTSSISAQVAGDSRPVIVADRRAEIVSVEPALGRLPPEARFDAGPAAAGGADFGVRYPQPTMAPAPAEAELPPMPGGQLYPLPPVE